MALRLVRQTSETPNITNKDDTIMTRYAYGGYNGIVKGFGSECGYTSTNGVFKVLDGRIVIDGWEIDVDGAGWILDLSNITGSQYLSVYAEINVATESVKLDSTYLTGSYPEINKGDDLTQTPNGTAKLLLYNVKVQNGLITEVIKRFQIIPYLAQKVLDIEERLTALGFKEGVADVVYQSFPDLSVVEFEPISNSLIKQGKHCIFNYSSGSLDGQIVINQMTIPEGFRPQTDTNIVCCGTNVYTNNSVFSILTVKSDGNVEGFDFFKDYTILNAGWRIK